MDASSSIVVEIPRFPGVGWVGDPLAGDNSFMVTSADTRPFHIYRDMALLTLQKNGHQITPEVLRVVEQFALEKEREFYAPIRARGVPQVFKDLFAASRKKDLERVASTAIVAKQDLADLVLNCGQVGLSHHSKHVTFVPEERELSDADREVLFAAGDRAGSPNEEKAFAKVRQLIVERKHRAIHLFANSGDVWHCLFLTFEDIADDAGNHWREGGQHLHLVNHVFDPKRLTKKKVWKGLQERQHSVPSLHVRFREERTTEPESLVYIDGRSGRVKKVPVR